MVGLNYMLEIKTRRKVSCMCLYRKLKAGSLAGLLWTDCQSGHIQLVLIIEVALHALTSMLILANQRLNALLRFILLYTPFVPLYKMF